MEKVLKPRGQVCFKGAALYLSLISGKEKNIGKSTVLILLVFVVYIVTCVYSGAPVSGAPAGFQGAAPVKAGVPPPAQR